MEAVTCRKGRRGNRKSRRGPRGGVRDRRATGRRFHLSAAAAAAALPLSEQNSSALSSRLGRNKHWQLIWDGGLSLDLAGMRRQANRHPNWIWEGGQKGEEEAGPWRYRRRKTIRQRPHVSRLCQSLIVTQSFWLRVLHLQERNGTTWAESVGDLPYRQQTSQLVTGPDSNHIKLVMFSITRQNVQDFPQAALSVTLQHYCYIIIVCTILIQLAYRLATGGKWLICSGANKRSSSIRHL